jgi:transposase InsO family protein
MCDNVTEPEKPQDSASNNAAARRLLSFYSADTDMDDIVGIRQVFTRPFRPQTNGEVERFNRTLLEEWAYVRPYTSNEERVQLLQAWVHLYNHHRSHTALGGQSPVDRLNNLPGHYS